MMMATMVLVQAMEAKVVALLQQRLRQTLSIYTNSSTSAIAENFSYLGGL
jgi:hypothetical protein